MLKRLGQQIASLVPTPLPQSDAAFVVWAETILDLAGLPVNDSFMSAIGTAVLHLGPTTAYKPKLYFVLNLKKAVANQSAFNFLEAAREADRNAKNIKSVQNASEQVV